MKRRLLLAAGFAVLVAALPASGLGDSSRASANSTTYPDSIGEDPNAPDITSVVVSNDDAGLITFQINISNRPELTADMFALVLLDTDQNASTGDTTLNGADYAIQLVPGSVDLFKWNGTDLVPAPSQASLIYSYAPTGATIRINANDLGTTKAFNFAVIVASGLTTDAAGNLDFTNVNRDSAPDPGHGFFSYQVLTKLVLSVTAFTTAPKPARAGRPFSAALAANENDTGGPVQAGTVSCAATIAGKRIVAALHVLTNGVATCIWRLPAAARAKYIRGTITLTVRGVSVSRSFYAKIT